MTARGKRGAADGRRGGLAQAAEWMAAVLLVGLTALAATAGHTWLGELAASFRWHLGWLALAFGLVGLAGRRAAFAALALGLGGWHVYPEASLWWGRPDPAAARSHWTLATANLRWRNGQIEAVQDWIRGLGADVLFVQEVSPHWREALEELSDAYPHQIVSPPEVWGNDEWGTAVLSRVPFEWNAYIESPVDGYRPLIEVGLSLGGSDVTLRGLHPVRPAEPSTWRRRNAILRVMMGQDWDERSILMGDLNTTSTSPLFDELLAATGLRDSRAGFGRQPSFRPPPKLPFVRVSIDHILTGADFTVLERRTEAIPGSDHRSVVARVTLADAAP